MEDYTEVGKCCICGKEYTHWGNNAEPVKSGRCCDECNATRVIPARIEELRKEKL